MSPDTKSAIDCKMYDQKKMALENSKAIMLPQKGLTQYPEGYSPSRRFQYNVQLFFRLFDTLAHAGYVSSVVQIIVDVCQRIQSIRKLKASDTAVSLQLIADIGSPA